MGVLEKVYVSHHKEYQIFFLKNIIILWVIWITQWYYQHIVKTASMDSAFSMNLSSCCCLDKNFPVLCHLGEEKKDVGTRELVASNTCHKEMEGIMIFKTSRLHALAFVLDHYMTVSKLWLSPYVSWFCYYISVVGHFSS